METLAPVDNASPLRLPGTTDVVPFDYDKLAELFIGRGYGPNRHSMIYRRFEKGADAIRFAIEDLPATKLVATVLVSDENRFDGREVRKLYDDPDYPLPRPASSQRAATAADASVSRTSRRSGTVAQKSIVRA